MNTAILSSISTTVKTTTALDKSNSNEEDYDDEEEITEAAEVAVPFAITVVVIIILVATVIYAKFRKSRMRRNNPPQMPTISGGIPMSTAAFHNQAFRQHSNGSAPENMYCDPPPMYSGQMAPVIPVTPVYPPSLPYYTEAPPKYEDIVKTSANDETVININNSDDPNLSQQTSQVENGTTFVINNNPSQSAKISDENSTAEPQQITSSSSNIQNSSMNETNSLPMNNDINPENSSNTQRDAHSDTPL